MSRQLWSEVLTTAQIDSTAHGNSTTPTSILPGAARFALPANFFEIGRSFTVKARGRVSNIVTTPGTLTFEVRFGSTVVFSSGAIPLNVVAKTNVTWLLDILLTCREIGGTTVADLMGIGIFTSESVQGATAGFPLDYALPASAPVVGNGFDSTAAQIIDLFTTWSVANAGNTITTHLYTLESLN